MDVVTAFLNGELVEDIYMETPEGFPCPVNSRIKLKRGLYGLKQAPRQWYQKLSSKLIEMGFSMSSAEPCLFTRYLNGILVLILVYVDDLLIACSDESQVLAIKAIMKEIFKMTDMGIIKRFLGFEVLIKDNGIFLSQTKYTEGILKKYNMLECRSSEIPMSNSIDGKQKDLIDDNFYFSRKIDVLDDWN